MIKKQASIIFASAVGCAVFSIYALAQSNSLTTYRNDRFGYTLVYPAEMFQSPPSGDLPAEAQQGNSNRDIGQPPRNDADAPPETPLNEDGRTFVSLDNRTKILVFGGFNSENFSLTDYRSTILKEFKGYDDITYGPKGQTWFVLSGFRGENIYYQKVMFSCGGRIINALSITFPREQKPIYEPIIEGLEDNFRPARGRDCNEVASGGRR